MFDVYLLLLFYNNWLLFSLKNNIKYDGCFRETLKYKSIVLLCSI